MMAALWDGVERDLASSKHHFSMAVEFFHDLGQAKPGKQKYGVTMVFLHAMYAGYTSFEAGMKRLLSLIDEPLPKDAEWHKTLLNQLCHPVVGVRPSIIGTSDLALALSGLLGFRHVAAHIYDSFDEDRAGFAMRDAETYLAEIDAAIAKFRAAIDPD